MTLIQHLNGKPLESSDSLKLLSLNAGHFSSMQVRNGKIQGFSLHMDRLMKSSEFLFGVSYEAERIRDCIRTAIQSVNDCTLRVNMFSTSYNPATLSIDDLNILVTATEPADVSQQPVRVASVAFERFLPEIKHSGIALAALHYRKTALAKGFDDVLYRSDSGQVLEGSIWNIGFFDGDGFVFPSAPALEGIRLQLLIKGLQRTGYPFSSRPVTLNDLPEFRSAFLINSAQPGQPIVQIDEYCFVSDPTLNQLLLKIYEEETWSEP